MRIRAPEAQVTHVLPRHQLFRSLCLARAAATPIFLLVGCVTLFAIMIADRVGWMHYPAVAVLSIASMTFGAVVLIGGRVDETIFMLTLRQFDAWFIFANGVARTW